MTFGIINSFQYTQDTVLTWDNYRLGQDRILSKLDHFYTYTNQDGSTSCKEYFNVGGVVGSYHIPVHLSIELWGPHQQPSIYKMSSRYLGDPEVEETIIGIWNIKCQR
jgi:hypothetical protein